MAQIPRGKTVLRIESWSNSARVLLLRGVSGDLPFSFEHTTNADRSRAASDFTIDPYKFIRPELLSVAPVTVPVRRGECYVRVTLLHEDKIIAVLSAAYLTDSKTITWPPGVFESSTEGPGLLRTFVGTDPAAGAQINEEVPTNAVWKLKSVRASLITDATVVNRHAQIQVHDGTRQVWALTSSYDHIASSTVAYLGLPIGIEIMTPRWAQVTFGFPLDMYMFQGWSLRSSIEAGVAGDDWGAPVIQVEEWIQE